MNAFESFGLHGEPPIHVETASLDGCEGCRIQYRRIQELEDQLAAAERQLALATTAAMTERNRADDLAMEVAWIQEEIETITTWTPTTRR